MALHIATEEYFNSLEQFEQHLPENNPELIILKGHLLIERLLDKYLYINLEQPNKLNNARLTFTQKTALVSAMHHDTKCDWLWSNIKLFNQLRNELSHNLESDKLIKLLENFNVSVETSPEHKENTPPNNEYTELRLSIYSLHESLSLRVNL
ncbi:MAG: hypothetical protein KZQ77_04355 [Candidatus Thiodiazotropha sp. (ex Notomyrtea botanica)]|nr:hypothetical protein [Candidatus Thiodiazotropha sp. (ex Notomyrtea botanica)]